MSGEAAVVQNIPIVAPSSQIEPKDHAPDTSETSINQRTDGSSASMSLNVPGAGDLSKDDRLPSCSEAVPHSPSQQHEVSEIRGQESTSDAAAAPQIVNEETTSESPANFPWWKKIVLLVCISIIGATLSQVGFHCRLHYINWLNPRSLLLRFHYHSASVSFMGDLWQAISQLAYSSLGSMMMTMTERSRQKRFQVADAGRNEDKGCQGGRRNVMSHD